MKSENPNNQYISYRLKYISQYHIIRLKKKILYKRKSRLS